MRYAELGKTALTAPLYISISWGLVISYQLFTQTAVYSLIYFLNNFWSSSGELLMPSIDAIVFIHAFAWIFVLSSAIPAVILGKRRSILLQFLLCLTVTLVAVSVENLLTLMMGTAPATQIQALSIWFQNPLIAGLYLSAPYLFMLYLDLHLRKKGKKEEKLQEMATTYLEEPIPMEQEASDTAAFQQTNELSQVSQYEDKGRMNFLYGASAACFLTAVFTFCFGNLISATFSTLPYRLAYVAVFIALGIMLLGLRYYSGMHKQTFAHVWEEDRRYKLESVQIPTNESVATQILTSEPCELLEGGIVEQSELLQLQIQDQYYEPSHPQMENYDVRHPKYVIDSQC